MKKKENPQEKKKNLAPSEAVGKKKPEVPLQVMNVKTKSPPKSSGFRVKSESLSKKKPMCDSPQLLTKMNPLRRTKVDTLLKLVKPETSTHC